MTNFRQFPSYILYIQHIRHEPQRRTASCDRVVIFFMGTHILTQLEGICKKIIFVFNNIFFLMQIFWCFFPAFYGQHSFTEPGPALLLHWNLYITVACVMLYISYNHLSILLSIVWRWSMSRLYRPDIHTY